MNSPAIDSSAPSTLASFTLFQRLPTELKLKVWEYACSIPRTIDLWTDWSPHEVASTIFYSQSYHIELAHLPHPAVLSVCQEARNEALQHYTPEFHIATNPAPGLSAISPAKWYINWTHDIFVPKGQWNLVGFGDFVNRSLANYMERLAVDVNGSFWKDNLKDYVLDRNCWAFESVRELVLYDSKDDPAWKGHDYLSEFRRRPRDGVVGLGFVEAEFELHDPAPEVRRMLHRCWNQIDGKGHGFTGEPPKGIIEYLNGCPATAKEDLVRPEVRMMKFVRGIPQ